MQYWCTLLKQWLYTLPAHTVDYHCSKLLSLVIWTGFAYNCNNKVFIYPLHINHILVYTCVISKYVVLLHLLNCKQFEEIHIHLLIRL